MTKSQKIVPEILERETNDTRIQLALQFDSISVRLTNEQQQRAFYLFAIIEFGSGEFTDEVEIYRYDERVVKINRAIRELQEIIASATTDTEA